MVKRCREKKQQEETEKQQHVLVTEKVYLKLLLQKVFEITIRNIPANLKEEVDGTADLPARNLLQREEFHASPQSSWPDYFWS